ncbi:pectate lyase [Chitinophagaceae bacterium LB-8]|uniref:Pectate lyase n=1 Tax=Paraflavisolibacter caeni TaxID=2982496 RepID=A0A9X3BGQ7_9BACT|nr:pectate lyase [Paraflavisolibacter caeni]MCU7547988.1 pectate lyase [Paraflavisolibacter caeni]
MLNKFILSIFSAALLLQACAQTRKAQVVSSKQFDANQQVNVTNGQALAFPGAEGWGKYTSGGRGGKVMVVTNLNDDGPGSFRNAVLAKGPRIVVFAVSGTIHLEWPLSIKSDITIAGQTAPGDGICLADYPVQLGGDNIIVRYMRFRMGDRYQNKGKIDGAGGDDAFGGTRRNKIIIDHCTMSWSTDEVCSVYAGDSTTLQWNLLSEPLNYSYHFETGDTDFEHHGYGGIWGGKHASLHHNLFAHCNSRTPRFDGIRNSPIENADFRNNVIYDWGVNNVYAGEGGNYNIVNNYYKYGPSTNEKVKNRVVNPYKKEPKIPFGKFFLAGNYIDGAPEVTTNNWLGVIMEDGTKADADQAKVNTPFSSVAITMQSPQGAYEAVLKSAGASYRRDTLDQRIIKDVRNRTGRFIDVQGGFPHGTDYSISSKAWPVLQSLPAPKDSDADGMPDEWEQKNGLNANDATDASGNKLHQFYTNVEVYINSLTSKGK